MPHILVIEPDKTMAATIRQYLEPRFEVSVCHDAQSAISAADESRPDVVVLELAMPKHNGAAFLQEFRTYPDWIDIPVIIYSHIPREDTGLSEHEWHKLGVVTYQYKTTSKLANLSNAIEQNLNNYETA
jgi:two-component system response regulator AtoC